jgi:hypothetical protein
LKDLDGRATTVVRDTSNIIYVAVPPSELGWLDKVVKDMGCKRLDVDELPEHEIALCGTKTTHKKQHEGGCKSCRVLHAQQESQRPKKEKRERKPRKPRSSKSTRILAKIEPGQNFDLDGVITSVEMTRDRLLEAYNGLDDLAKNLRAYKDITERIPSLEQEAKDRMAAARKLLEGVK